MMWDSGPSRQADIAEKGMAGKYLESDQILRRQASRAHQIDDKRTPLGIGPTGHEVRKTRGRNELDGDEEGRHHQDEGTNGQGQTHPQATSPSDDVAGRQNQTGQGQAVDSDLTPVPLPGAHLLPHFSQVSAGQVHRPAGHKDDGPQAFQREDRRRCQRLTLRTYDQSHPIHQPYFDRSQQGEND